MDQLNTQPPQDVQMLDAQGIILSSVNSAELAALPPEVQIATMRQMMETLFGRVAALQQNQAVQFAAVHDRLDAVELELPLIQEQGALRIRDLEARIGVEIEEAARIAAEEVKAGLQEDVAGKFGSLMAHIEGQRKELTQMRESKKLADTRLNRAVQDIERLCGNLGPRPVEEIPRQVVDNAPASQFRTRIAEHIKKAAVEAAPDESNPLLKNPDAVVRPAEAVATAAQTPAPMQSAPIHNEPAPPLEALSTNAPASGSLETSVPGFDDWKRQFMQEGEPLQPTLGEPGKKLKTVICPRCCSERTRPATLTRFDGLFRMTGFIPHRCRSCAYRFYKRGAVSEGLPLDEDGAQSPTEEAI